MKLWLHENDMEMYSTHNEGKSERFIRALKNKHMAVASKNVYIDKLDETVDKYNKTYKTIKMKPANFQPSAYIEYGVENNEKVLTSKLGIV